MKRVLVLGAYGLIGSAVVRELRAAGIEVTGMGRSQHLATRTFPDLNWIIADLTTLSVDDWAKHLSQIDVVVNAAGALQDGRNDKLHDIHDRLVGTLVAAIGSLPIHVVQVSAAGVSPDASTEFFRSKARGDAHLAASDLEWTILRPTFVVGAGAYGGTALLRGAAGLPGLAVRMFEHSKIQTIALSELVNAVVAVALGQVASRRIYDLSEAGHQSFPELVDALRNWLGFKSVRWHVPIPKFLLRATAGIADALGWLGWRPQLRSAALQTIEEGIVGDPSDWVAAGGTPFGDLSNTLSAIPATLQERWFARLYLFFPMAIALLAIFWMLSGIIGLTNQAQAASYLTARGFTAGGALAFVIVGAIADLVLGLLILFRPFARMAATGMIWLSFAYLMGATVFASDLWADPLGPLVKVIPSVGLALIARAMLEER